MSCNSLNFFVTLYLVSLCLCINPQHKRNSWDLHLGSKSAYRNVANYNTKEIKFDNCRAVKIWGLVRHGTRNPSYSLIEKMRTRLVDIRDMVLERSENTTLPEINTEMINLELLKSWSPTLLETDNKKLTEEGEDEMFFLAERMQKRFPKLIGKVYSNPLYKFKYTDSQRTKKSAEAFTSGLFGRHAVKNVDFPEPSKYDPILRFYKLCKKWSAEVKANPTALQEQTKFQEGNETAETVKAVNGRLGLDDELSFDDVHMMYMICAFETAWTKQKMSPWCSVFNLTDFEVMEYGEDLKYYWRDGYGYEVTYKQACVARNDLMEFFENKETFPKTKIYFTHSGTLLKMLAHFGLYQHNKQLLADDFHENANRTWRVSYIDPFGTNLVFVLFSCQDGDKILTLHQEKVVRLPCCQDSDLCSMDKFTCYYNTKTHCVFDQICQN